MFLGPNILGVLTFVVLPVLFSVLLALTNWDLRRHNMYKRQPLEYVGLDNFARLLADDGFYQALGNTLFLMMVIPFSVAASLAAAMLLSRDAGRGEGRLRLAIAIGAVLTFSVAGLAAMGAGATALVVLLTGIGGLILLGGLAGGSVVHRTLFYMPHFVAGVPTFVLWKKLYNPQNGPVNTAMRPVLESLGTAVRAMPDSVCRAGGAVLAAGMIVLLAMAMRRLRRGWADGETGGGPALLSGAVLLIPILMAAAWSGASMFAACLLIGAGLVVAWQGVMVVRGTERLKVFRRSEGLGSALVMALAAMAGQFVLLGLAVVLWRLPELAADGLEAPPWIYDPQWAKPSLMIMMLWAAVGSNNMLLYLAALTNIPLPLYEAADVDGAGRWSKFWHVTWPQLAPTTFFIAVMSTISGLQGGFEMARTMTAGGPSGATTTLSYYVYIHGFETGRLSYASATAWVLFALILTLTVFNWKFGNRYVND